MGALRRLFSLDAPGDRECQDQVAEFLLEVRQRFFLEAARVRETIAAMLGKLE